MYISYNLYASILEIVLHSCTRLALAFSGANLHRKSFGTGQLLFLIFLMASHILTFTVALNTITGHATCSIVFGVVGQVLSLILSLPRTVEKIYWLSLVCEFLYYRTLRILDRNISIVARLVLGLSPNARYFTRNM
jgi:hypothetical protein